VSFFGASNPLEPDEEIPPWRQQTAPLQPGSSSLERPNSTDNSQDVKEQAPQTPPWSDEEKPAPPPAAPPLAPTAAKSRAPSPLVAASAKSGARGPWTPMAAASSHEVPRPSAAPEQELTKGEPGPPKRYKNNYSQEQIAYYKHEAQLAKDLNIGWRERGPRPEFGPMPDTWKGGTWRPNAKRWATRGGKKLEERNQKYGKKK